MKNKLFTISLLIFLFSVASFAQNGARLIDYNAKSSGRAGTNIGIFDNNSLMLTNPAGISFLNKSQIEVNFTSMFPSLHFKNDLNDVDGEDSYYPMPSLSYVSSCNKSKWSWGVGAFTVGGMGAEFNLNHALFQEKQNYYSNLGILQFGPTVAYKVSDKFSIGVTAHVVYAMMDFRMPYSMSPMVLQGVIPGMGGMTFGDMFAAPASMGGFGYDEVTAYASMDDLSAISFNGKIGIAFKPNDKVSFGLTYSMPTKLNFKDGSAKMDMNAQFEQAMGLAVQGAIMQGMSQAEAQAYVMNMFAGMGVDLMAGMAADYDLEIDLEMPQSVGLGVSVEATDNFRFAVDLEWLNWENSFNKMTMKTSNGTNANINLLMGNTGSFEMDFPMKWEDTYLVKLGAEYDLNCALTLRGGFVYGTNPVPDNTVFPVFPAIVENHLTLGASYKVSDLVSLHLAYERALENEQTASSDNIIANEYKNSVSTLGNDFIHFALTWEL